MTVFENYLNALVQRQEAQEVVEHSRDEVEKTLLDMIEKKGEYQTAQALSMESGLPSQVIANILYHKKRGQTTTVTKYALIRPDGTPDMSHVTTRKRKVAIYGAYHDNWYKPTDEDTISCPYEAAEDRAKPKYEGPSYQEVWNELLKNLTE